MSECVLALRDDSNTSNGTVAVLSYTRRELLPASESFRSRHIPHEVVREGEFYKSESVRDFYAFLSSFVYPNDTVHLFNYLRSPYYSGSETIRIDELTELEGDPSRIIEHLNKIVDLSQWHEYEYAFRDRPVLSVITQAVESIDVVGNHCIRANKRIMNDPEIRFKQDAIKRDVTEYRLNLDKLLVKLQEKISRDNTTIYEICDFLENAIATNRDEDVETDPESIRSNPVQCLTVHKAKGLEYDTVIIPFTSYNFDSHKDKVIVSETNKTVWKMEKSSQQKSFESRGYQDAIIGESDKILSDACHLLYVAMTRARRNLIIYLDESKTDTPVTWSWMLAQCNPTKVHIGHYDSKSKWKQYFQKVFQ